MSDQPSELPDRRENPFRAPTTVSDPPVEGLVDAETRRRRRVGLIVVATFAVPAATLVAFFCCCMGTGMILGGGLEGLNAMFAAGCIGGAATGIAVIVHFAKKIRRVG